MIKKSCNIQSAKSEIMSMQGKKVAVTVNLGRNKTENFEGVLNGVYPALFTVKPDVDGYRGKTAYSYSEYLCGNVALRIKT